MGSFAFIAFLPSMWVSTFRDFRRSGASLQRTFRQGASPVPCTTFAANEVRPAFEHMAKARHIGKIVFSLACPQSLRMNASAAPTGLP